MSLLQRQSEDCLYLNLYVPDGAKGLPVTVLLHGESFDWGAGSLYDGSYLASHGHVLVATLNYRVGVLGESKPVVGVLGESKPLVGVWGESKPAVGVLGESKPAVGVLGESKPAVGVMGESKPAVGVLGESKPGVGVLGESKPAVGVLGESKPPVGVLGESKSAVGVLGESKPPVGVLGKSKPAVGVLGESKPPVGVLGESKSAIGVLGESKSAVGVLGESKSEVGVLGEPKPAVVVLGKSKPAVGVLGFFNAMQPGSRPIVANYGLMDQLASLHWLQENIGRFGGDPAQVTVMAHSYGAACLSLLILSPAASASGELTQVTVMALSYGTACLSLLIISPAASGSGLFRRVVLMSGTALSPWALVRDPAHYAHQVATQLACPFPQQPATHAAYEKLLHCIRNRSVEQILKVQLSSPQFLSAIGPSEDGVTVKPDWRQRLANLGSDGKTQVEVLLGVSEVMRDKIFTEEQEEKGIDANTRDKLVRTFVANNYHYHLQELVLAITAEYTDWARPSQHPLALRDMTAEALHDASLVAPALTAANSFSSAKRNTFFYVLDNRPRDQSKPAVGVLGESKPAVGVLGKSKPAVGLLGESKPAVGVLGESNPAVGVLRESKPAVGVLGKSKPAVGVLGESKSAVGVLGES
ncbi:hypothetical protein HAZT_HAZT006092, partial [Hyalella azteca]